MIKSTFRLPMLLVACVVAGCMHAPGHLREASPSDGREESSGSDGLLARSLQLDDEMLGKADRALDAFNALQIPGSSSLVWLDESRSMFAVREGFGFPLCQYEAVIGTSDRGDGGNRVLIALADSSVSARGERGYLQALPSYERASIGECGIVVTPVTRVDGAWLVFVVGSRSSHVP